MFLCGNTVCLTFGCCLHPSGGVTLHTSSSSGILSNSEKRWSPKLTGPRWAWRSQETSSETLGPWPHHSWVAAPGFQLFAWLGAWDKVWPVAWLLRSLRVGVQVRIQVLGERRTESWLCFVSASASSLTPGAAKGQRDRGRGGEQGALSVTGCIPISKKTFWVCPPNTCILLHVAHKAYTRLWWC